MVAEEVAVDFQAADREIRAAWTVETGRNRRTMLIGYLAAQMKRTNAWTAGGGILPRSLLNATPSTAPTGQPSVEMAFGASIEPHAAIRMATLSE